MLTGGQIATNILIKKKIPWIAGIPGHGCLGLVDAFAGYKDKLPLYLVRHEQSAVHMADGYYRVTGDPAAAFTSIGPGALNLAVGLGTSYVDSTAVLALIGETHSYMFGKGVLQEIERKRVADSLKVLEPVTKHASCATTVKQLPHSLNRAFAAMKTGRPGPAVVALTMDVQSEGMEFDIDKVADSYPGAAVPDGSDILRAARLLAEAKRPVILAGGGVLRAGAFGELKSLAERLGAAVITTMAGKSCFPEDHPLYAFHAGSKGTRCGNELASGADVLLAVGCRFADETTSSYRRGISFNIPPTKLIHADIDPSEIGKNYEADVALVGEAKYVLQSLVAELGNGSDGYRDRPYTAEITKRRESWLETLESFRSPEMVPVTLSKALSEIRKAVPADGFIVTSSGHAQAQVFQEFMFNVPGTLVTTGGFSTMGFALPAAMGVKLAHPGREAVVLVGDGDFLMTGQEMATAVQYGIAVKVVVFNNSGFLAIRDLQKDVYGEERDFATEFLTGGGNCVTPDFVGMARSFGVEAARVSDPGDVEQAMRVAIRHDGPYLLEIETNRQYPHSGGKAAGWWDVPIPIYLKERRKAYEDARTEEELYR